MDSGRGSPLGSGSIPSLRKKRNRFRGNGKPPWTHSETLHPRRLAELGRFTEKEQEEYYVRTAKSTEINYESLNQNYICDNRPSNYDEIYNNNENVNCRKKSTQKSYHCPSTGKLHSTLLSDYPNPKSHTKRTTKCCSKRESKHKQKNSENIEKLMKLILAQGATIQSQLQKLKEREEQIELIEQERHRERIEKNGRNYLLETYLGSLKEAEIPVEVDEERADDSGVNTEGGSDQMNAIKKKNMERLKQRETELDSDTIEKNPGRRRLEQVHRDEDLSGRLRHTSTETHQKSVRSRSEVRTHELKAPEVNLKRTLSDNSIANASGLENEGNKEKNSESDMNSGAKEESDEVMELNSIRSQIQIWEKVFKINKKLEKEEENLVRLHIKIKKFHNENSKFTKEAGDKEISDEKLQSNNEQNVVKKPSDSSLDGDSSQNYVEMKKNLETLKADLEQNSKEIYRNFTKLIEEDERVEQKRNCLTKLLSDLERTKHEQNMLNEMINVKEKRLVDDNNQALYCSSSITMKEPEEEANFSEFPDSGVENRNARSMKRDFPGSQTSIGVDNYLCSKIPEAPQSSENCTDQSTEVNKVVHDKVQLLKPKIVKISFEDEIQSCENLEDKEKLVKEPVTVCGGALKGILKNRNQTYNSDMESYNLSSETQNCKKILGNCESNYYNAGYGNTNGGFDKVNSSQTVDVPDANNYNYSQAVFATMYNQPLHDPNINYFVSSPLANNYDLKTAYPLKSSNAHEIQKSHANIFPHSTMVKTKAVILNDTDSSTSSDTSGLCSMYSSSPSVEQPYIEHGYILDTLV